MKNRLVFALQVVLAIWLSQHSVVVHATTISPATGAAAVAGGGTSTLGGYGCMNKTAPPCFTCPCPSLLPGSGQPDAAGSPSLRTGGNGTPSGCDTGRCGPGPLGIGGPFGLGGGVNYASVSTEGSASNGPSITAGYDTVSNSVINGYTQGYFHFGIDVQQVVESGVMLQRTHRSRDLLGQSSFGPGVYGQYDVSLTVLNISQATLLDPSNSRVHVFQDNTYNPDNTSFSSGPFQSWIPAIEAVSPTTGSLFFLQADRVSPPSQNTNYWGDARFAELRGKHGEKYVFELWEDTSLQNHVSGYSTTYASLMYPLNGRLIEIIDRSGRKLSVNYHFPASGTTGRKQTQIKEVVDYTGAKISFEYHTSTVAGNWAVSTVTAPGGQVSEYAYSGNQLTQITRRISVGGAVINQSTFTHGFDTTSNCATIAFDDPAAYLRDGGHRKKTVHFSNLSGVVGPMVFSSSVNCTRMIVNAVNEVTYLSLDALTSGAGPFNSGFARFIYEGGGRMKVIDGGSGPLVRKFLDGWNLSGSTVTGTLEANYQSQVVNSYNTTTERTVVLGAPVEEMSETGLTKTYDYDVDNWLVRTVHGDGSFETKCYNERKQVVRERDRNGDVIRYAYAADGLMISKEVGLRDHPSNATNDPYASYDRCATNDIQTPRYLQTTWTFDATSRRLTSISVGGRQTDYQYDAQGRVIKRIDPSDVTGGTRPETLFAYDSVTNRLTSQTDPLGRVVTFEYDPLGRLVKTLYQDGTSDRTIYASTGKVSKTVDRLGIVTTYAYDAADRLITKTVASGFMDATGTESSLTDGTIPDITTYAYLNGTEVVTKITHNGADTLLAYDYRGREISRTISPRSGKTLVTSRNYVKNQLFSTTDPNGRKAYYLYSASTGRMIRTIQGTIPEYSKADYDQVANEVRVSTPNATFVIQDMQYDPEGRVILKTDARNIQTKYEYDLTDTINPSASLSRVIQAFGTTVESKTETLYDSFGNVLEVRSPRYFDSSDTNGSTKARETWTYTGRNLVATHTEAPGTPEAATESFTFTLSGRRSTQVDFRGNTWTTNESGCCALTRTSIDPLGHGTITNANSKGQVVHTATVSDVSTHSSNYNNPIDAKTHSETTTRYDGRGRPIYQTTWLTPRGIVDTANPPIAGLNGVALADGLTTQYLYDDNLFDGVGLDNGTGLSAPKLGTGGTGTTNISLSAAISKLSSSQASGGAGITFTATAPGRATVTISSEDEISFSISDAAGRTVMTGKLNNYKGTGPTAANTLASWSCTLHDATQSLAGYGTVLETRSIDALGFATRTWTDAAGRTMRSLDQLDKATAFTYDAGGNQLSVRDPNSVGADMLYDALGRNTQRTDTFGDVTKTDYDRAGNAIKQTDAKNKFTLISFDARNRRKSTSDRISAATTFTYLPTGQLASLTDAENQVTSYTYDARGSKLTEQYPDHTTGAAVAATGYGIVTFVYDNAGRMLRKQDQAGVTCTYNYDLAGRMTSRNYRTAANSPSGTIADSDTFTFDRAGRMLTAISGRYTNTVGYAYDLVGRKSSESLTIAAQTYTVASAYNARNELTKHTYPDASIADRAYDARGSLNQLKLDNTIIDTRTYDDGGRMATEVLGNGITETRAYRTDNLLSTISYSNTNIGNLTYSWDANKNKTAEAISGVMSGYGFSAAGTTYDFEDRLTAFARGNGTMTQSWNLTSVGDWTSVTTNGTAQTRTHGPTHELLTAGGQNVTTDVRGNMTVIPAVLRSSTATTPMNLSYDFDNRLRTADIDNNASADVSFEYDALGRRVARTQGATAVVYFQADQQTIADYPRGGAATTASFRYVFGSYIDEPVVRKTTGTGGTIVYYHRNQQYSIYALSNSSGTVTERYAYTAYGQPTFLNASAAVQTSSAANNRYTYTAREWDPTIGLFHFRARYMSGLSGRFCSRDPIGYGHRDKNLYQYVRARSLIGMDPRGNDLVIFPGPEHNPGNGGGTTIGGGLPLPNLGDPIPYDPLDGLGPDDFDDEDDDYGPEEIIDDIDNVLCMFFLVCEVVSPPPGDGVACATGTKLTCRLVKGCVKSTKRRKYPKYLCQEIFRQCKSTANRNFSRCKEGGDSYDECYSYYLFDMSLCRARYWYCRGR